MLVKGAPELFQNMVWEIPFLNILNGCSYKTNTCVIYAIPFIPGTYIKQK